MRRSRADLLLGSGRRQSMGRGGREGNGEGGGHRKRGRARERKERAERDHPKPTILPLEYMVGRLTPWVGRGTLRTIHVPTCRKADFFEHTHTYTERRNQGQIKFSFLLFQSKKRGTPQYVNSFPNTASSERYIDFHS